MSAKEMFNKLGYELIWNKDNIIAYEINEVYSYPQKHIIIEFDSNRKIFKVFDTGIGISIKTLQAINKQVEELGWNNE